MFLQTSLILLLVDQPPASQYCAIFLLMALHNVHPKSVLMSRPCEAILVANLPGTCWCFQGGHGACMKLGGSATQSPKLSQKLSQ